MVAKFSWGGCYKICVKPLKHLMMSPLLQNNDVIHDFKEFQSQSPFSNDLFQIMFSWTLIQGSLLEYVYVNWLIKHSFKSLTRKSCHENSVCYICPNKEGLKSNGSLFSAKAGHAWAFSGKT